MEKGKKLHTFFGLFLGFALFTTLPVMAQNARLQLIHNSADIDARNLVVLVNGDSTLEFSFRTATAFMDFAPGSYDFAFVADFVTELDTIGPVSVTLEAGISYVGMVNGITPRNITEGKYVNPEPGTRDIGLTLFAIPNARETAEDPTKVEFFVFHGSTDALAVDVIVNKTTPPLVDDLGYGQWTSYFAVDPGVDTLDVTPADDNTTILASFEADLSGLSGSTAVVFASGFVDPVNNQGGQPLGLFAALADGQVLEFTSLIVGPIGDWTFTGLSDYQFSDFFGADTLVSGGHGVVVDKYNRIWVGNFYDFLRVMNPDGTEASFSPLDTAVVGQNAIALRACRGMAVASDGNILFATGSNLVKLNVETGEGMALFVNPDNTSFTAPAVDGEGFIYAGNVVGVTPIKVVHPNTFELVQTIDLAGAPGFGRGIEVTADGRTIFTPDLGESGGPVYFWTTEDFVTYTKTDSAFTDTQGQLLFKSQRITMDFNPVDSTLWVSVDNAYNVNDNSPNSLVILDLKTREYKVLAMPEIGPGIGNGPRGVGFSVTGDTAYAISWNGNRMFRFVKRPVSVERPDTNIPRVFELGQNYPNPFNPTTTIPFTLARKSVVELKVFNVRGQEVATILNKAMPAGKHVVTFDASGLASGTYYYQLSVDDKVMAKKMLLIR